MKTIIMPIDNGPYDITGDVEILDGEGKKLGNSEAIPVALCRCGHSGNKPFCDGSHAREGFTSEIRAAK
jgi:CDGSH-type Zn-finger protein